MNDQHTSGPEAATRESNWRVLSLVGGAVVVALLAYFFWPSKPAQEDTVTTSPAVEAVAPAKSAEERGDSAREIIADLKSATGPVNYELAYTRAQEFRASGRLADAQLLYFFAAKGAYQPALFELATMYDPSHFSSGESLLDEPDAFQAYKWYRQAQTAGDPRVDQRLADLRAWAESASKAGNADAERLLLQWE